MWEDRKVEGDHLVEVGRAYGLHEVQIRALGANRDVSQIIEGESWLVINFIVPRLLRKSIKADKLTVFMNEEKIVTMHTADMPILDELEDRLELHPQLSKSPSGVLAVIADLVTDQYTPIIDYVDEAVDKTEDLIVDRPNDRQLHQLFHYKKLLVELRRIVIPTTAVLDQLSDGRYDIVADKSTVYLRDSYDFSWRTHELIDTQRDLLTNALDTYLSVVSNNLNGVMKRLTVISSIFMPISFLTGFGGMNFVKQIPFGNDMVYGILIGLIVVTPLAMLGYYKHKKWL